MLREIERKELVFRMDFRVDPCKSVAKKSSQNKKAGATEKVVALSASPSLVIKLVCCYFTMILPLGSSVPCTRTRLPSNFATSL